MTSPCPPRAQTAVLVLCCIILSIPATATATTSGRTGQPANCTDAVLSATLSDLHSAVNSLVSDAHSAAVNHRIDVSRELAIANLSTTFSVFGAYDGVNSTSVVDAVYNWVSSSRGWPQSVSEAVSRSAPCLELNNTLSVVRHAIDGLRAAVAQPTPRLPVPPTFTAQGAVFSPFDGAVHSSSPSNTPLFPVGFCSYSCFMPLSIPQVDLLQAAGNLAPHSWVGANLVTLLINQSDSSVVVNKTEVQRITAAAAQLASHGIPVHLYLRQHPMPDWLGNVLGQNEVAGDAKQSLDFNVDTNGVMGLWFLALSALLPALADSGASPWTIMAANEVWASQPASVSSSPGKQSLYRLRQWLSDQYHANVTAWNDAWGTHYDSFDSLDSFPTKHHPSDATRVAVDWNRWLHNRTTWWFERLTANIRLIQPHALLSLKNKNYGSWGSFNNGFDREAVARITGVVGVDARSMPGQSGWTKISDPLWEAHRWAFDFRSPMLSYTYMRSIGRVSVNAVSRSTTPGLSALCALYEARTGTACPSTTTPSTPPTFLYTPSFDSETHFSSVSKARVFNISWAHGHTTTLLSAVSGLSLRSMWYWSRHPSGSLTETTGAWSPGWTGTGGIAGASGTQPSFLAGVSEGVRTVNVGAQSVLALGTHRALSDTAPTLVCQLRCDASRFVDGAWSTATLEGFAGSVLASAGDTVFVTDRQIQDGDLDSNSDTAHTSRSRSPSTNTNANPALFGCATIVVPGCGYASDAVVSAVRKFVDGSVHKGDRRVIVLPSSDSAFPAFGYTELGLRRPSSELVFLSQTETVSVINVAEASALAVQFDRVMPPKSRPVVCHPVGEVVCKSVERGPAGQGETNTQNGVLFVMNPRPYAQKVTLFNGLTGGGAVLTGHLIDVATGFSVGSASEPLSLSPEQSLLLKVNL